jgi:hypothetical protein
MLPAEELPDTDPIDTLPKERRSELRYECRLKILHRASEQEERSSSEIWYMGKLLDISCRGIAVSTRVRYFPGTIISITISKPGGGREQQLLARATNLTYVAEAQWRIGCELLEPLSENELKSLVQQSLSD